MKLEDNPVYYPQQHHPHCICQVSARFLDWMKYGRSTPVSEQTHTSYARALKTVTRHCSHFDIRELQEPKLRFLKMILYDRGCAISYVYRILSVLRSLVRYCIDEENIKGVIEPRQIKLPKRPKQQVEFLSTKEIWDMFSAVSPVTIYGLRMRALIATLLDSGMRITEALSVDRDDIHFDSKQPHIWIVGKGRSKRRVMLRPFSVYWLRRYFDERTDSCPAAFASSNNRHSKKWWRMTDRGARKQFELLRKKVGNDKVKCHVTRRTFATHLRKGKADIKSIQNALGHQSLMYTERYLGVDDEEVQQVCTEALSYGQVEMAR